MGLVVVFVVVVLVTLVKQSKLIVLRQVLRLYFDIVLEAKFCSNKKAYSRLRSTFEFLKRMTNIL